jgi:hypothetical protein
MYSPTCLSHLCGLKVQTIGKHSKAPCAGPMYFNFANFADPIHPCSLQSKLGATFQVQAQQQGGGPAKGSAKGPPPKAVKGGSRRKQHVGPSSRKPSKQGKPAGRVSSCGRTNVVCEADLGSVLEVFCSQCQTSQLAPAPGCLYHPSLVLTISRSMDPTLQPQQQSNSSAAQDSMLSCPSHQHHLLPKPSKQQLTWQL